MKQADRLKNPTHEREVVIDSIHRHMRKNVSMESCSFFFVSTTKSNPTNQVPEGERGVGAAPRVLCVGAHVGEGQDAERVPALSVRGRRQDGAGWIRSYGSTHRRAIFFISTTASAPLSVLKSSDLISQPTCSVCRAFDFNQSSHHASIGLSPRTDRAHPTPAKYFFCSVWVGCS